MQMNALITRRILSLNLTFQKFKSCLEFFVVWDFIGDFCKQWQALVSNDESLKFGVIV